MVSLQPGRPKGTLIALQSNPDDNWEIYHMDANGADPIDLTNDSADD
jgi:Tol biopolymer transport system component